MERWRVQVCEGLAGSVVEIGFGSGPNVAHYPSSVRQVYVVEPSRLARRIADKRNQDSNVTLIHAGLDGQSIDLPDESCDSALCTFTLCTVENPDRVLSEILRILRPGGRLHLLEHGISPDVRVATWQRRLDGLEQRLADGCHLTRDPLALVARTGLTTVWSKQRYARGPKPWSYFTVGIFEKPCA